jgi:AcrR family transcriptional regulator
MKEKIKHCARQLFDQNGFHGTSMRDIAKMAECKPPTVYHYFESKEALFDEAVRITYINFVAEQPERALLPEEYCVETLLQVKALSVEEARIHRLALKIGFGGDGSAATREKLRAWEIEQNERHIARMLTTISSVAWAQIIMRTLSDLRHRILFFNEDLSEGEIREIFRLLFAAAQNENGEKVKAKAGAPVVANRGGTNQFDPVLW